MTVAERHSSSITPDDKVKWLMVTSTPFLAVGSVTLRVPNKDAYLTDEEFFELREAVNDLYDHIRQETP